MGTKTTAEIKQALDGLLLEDGLDVSALTLERKRRAINRAIRSAWPNFKVAKEDANAAVLATGTSKYPLADILDIGDMGNGVGICQVLLEMRAEFQDWVPLRTVTQSQAGTTWCLHVPERIVDANVGRKLKLRYYARMPEFTSEEFTLGSGALSSEFANYVLYAAAVDLMGWHVQRGTDDNVEDALKLISLYTARALMELKANTVYCMPILVGVEAEASASCWVPSYTVGNL